MRSGDDSSISAGLNLWFLLPVLLAVGYSSACADEERAANQKRTDAEHRAG